MSSQRTWIEGLPTRLRLSEPLGSGATSRVWRARDLVVGTDVVVKVIDVDGAAARLEREARALARLRDVDGVVAVHELGRSPSGAGWLVCDLAPGGSLRDRLADGRAPDLDEVRRMAGRLATALAAAHARRVVHGDLSPANVLFDADGAALLADFGAADLDGTSDPVRQGLTPAFAAPERRRGAAASPAGDVWSLAATLRAALAAGATGGDGGDPGSEVADGELSALLEQCAAEHPSNRPTAAQMATALGASARPGRRATRSRRRRSGPDR